jgi:hypothetical protein
MRLYFNDPAICFTTDKAEQCINFVSIFKKPAAETHRMQQEAFGANTMNQSNTFLWYNASRTDDRLSTYTSTPGFIRARGGGVVEALRYKPEGRGIDSR